MWFQSCTSIKSKGAIDQYNFYGLPLQHRDILERVQSWTKHCEVRAKPIPKIESACKVTSTPAFLGLHLRCVSVPRQRYATVIPPHTNTLSRHRQNEGKTGSSRDVSRCGWNIHKPISDWPAVHEGGEYIINDNLKAGIKSPSMARFVMIFFFFGHVQNKMVPRIDLILNASRWKGLLNDATLVSGL